MAVHGKLKSVDVLIKETGNVRYSLFPSLFNNVVLTCNLPRYTLRRAACRLLASPSPITRSRLTALPHTHLPVVVRRPITQSRRSLGDAKSPLGSKDAPAASTATNSDTTTATATADNALDLSPPVENYAEAVEKDVMKGDLKNELELSSGTTGAATARAVSTKETKQEDGGTCKNLNLKSSDSTRNTSGVPTAPEYEAGAEKVREGRPSGTIIANTAPTGATSGVPRASSNAPGAEKAQTLNQGLAAKLSLSESLTKSTTVDEQDPDLDFDISQIREAAAQEAWAAAEKKQMTHGEKLDMLRRLQYEPKQTVFIGNLFYDVTAEDLKKQMAKYGVVEGVNIIYDSRGISKGYGYVQFSSNAAARRAIDAMHMRIFEGRRVTLYYAQTNITNSFKNKKPTNTLYIGNVPFEMTDRDLNDLVKDLDGLTDVRVTVDRQSGALRGYIHAEFLDIQSAMVAHEKLAQRRPYGRRLKIDYSKTKSAQGGFPVAV